MSTTTPKTGYVMSQRDDSGQYLVHDRQGNQLGSFDTFQQGDEFIQTRMRNDRNTQPAPNRYQVQPNGNLHEVIDVRNNDVIERHADQESADRAANHYNEQFHNTHAAEQTLGDLPRNPAAEGYGSHFGETAPMGAGQVPPVLNLDARTSIGGEKPLNPSNDNEHPAREKLIASLKTIRQKAISESEVADEDVVNAIVDVAAMFILSVHEQSTQLERMANALTAQTKMIAMAYSHGLSEDETKKRILDALAAIKA